MNANELKNAVAEIIAHIPGLAVEIDEDRDFYFFPRVAVMVGGWGFALTEDRLDELKAAATGASNSEELVLAWY